MREARRGKGEKGRKREEGRWVWSVSCSTDNRFSRENGGGGVNEVYARTNIQAYCIFYQEL